MCGEGLTTGGKVPPRDSKLSPRGKLGAAKRLDDSPRGDLQGARHLAPARELAYNWVARPGQGDCES
jgi:hypothetical protein